MAEPPLHDYGVKTPLSVLRCRKTMRVFDALVLRQCLTFGSQHLIGVIALHLSNASILPSKTRGQAI